MRKILLLIAIALSLTMLSGCFDGVYIEPDQISVVYENGRYEGTSFFIDVYITNGFETDDYISYMEFDIYSEDEELYIAAAGFDIEDTIPANDYIEIELEFEDEFVFASETEFNAANYDLDYIVLFYWIENK
ncbi:MAG: hypothetical protein KAH16_04180 [Candidatus Izimaplasma sp.]|nr:hypothetical protein [Candidatus Izimaplasma bacterium]